MLLALLEVQLLQFKLLRHKQLPIRLWYVVDMGVLRRERMCLGLRRVLRVPLFIQISPLFGRLSLLRLRSTAEVTKGD